MSDNINVEVKRKNPSIPPKNLRELTKQVSEIEGTIDDINESVEEAEQDVHEIKNAIDNSNDFTVRNGKMVRKNKRYAPAQYSGLGEVYLEKNETFLGREFEEFVTNVTVPDPSIIADAIDGIVYDRGRKEFLAFELVEGERVYYAEWNKFDKWESVEDYTPDAGYDFICEADNKAYRWTEETTPDLIETEAHYGNVLKQEMVNFSNTIYHIQYDYDLIGKEITIPEGCVLQFEGGSFINGIIVGDNTEIKEAYKALKIILKGTFANKEFHSSTFDIFPSTDASVCTTRLQSLLDISSVNYEDVIIYLDWEGTIEFTETLNVGKHTKLIGRRAVNNIKKVVNSNSEEDCVIRCTGEYIHLEELRIWSGNYSQIGVKCDSVYRSYFSRLAIQGYNKGMYFMHSWLITIYETAIQSCNTGVHIEGPATSFTCIRVYLQNQIEHGFSISSLGYSTFINCANDNAQGGVDYSLYGTSASFINCGSESTKSIKFGMDRSSVNIVGGNFHFEEWPEGYTPTGREGLITTFSSQVTVNSATFGSSGKAVDIALIADVTSGNYKPSSITLNSINRINIFEPDRIINNGSGVINYNDVYGNNFISKGIVKKVGDVRSSQIALNTGFSYLNSNYEREPLGTIYLPTDADKKEYYASVLIDDSYKTLGTVISAETDGDYYRVIFKPNDSEINYIDLNNKYRKANGYILKFGDNIVGLAYTVRREVIDSTEKYVIRLYKDCNFSGITTNMSIYVFRYKKLGDVAAVSDSGDTAKVIRFTNLFEDNTAIEGGSSNSIVGFNGASDDNVFITGISSINYTSKEITVANSNITRGQLSNTTVLYEIKNSNKIVDSAKRTIPYIIIDNMRNIENKINKGMYASGQFLWGFNERKIVIVQDNEYFFANALPSDVRFYGGVGTFPSNPVQGQIYYDWDLQKLNWFIGNNWIDEYGNDKDVKHWGPSNQRPSNPNQGTRYYDNTLKVPIYWNGSIWTYSDGISVDACSYGTFAQKPSSSLIPVGFRYFCTDKQTTEGATNGIEIIYKGQDTTDPDNPVDVWVDALGRIVS